MRLNEIEIVKNAIMILWNTRLFWPKQISRAGPLQMPQKIPQIYAHRWVNLLCFPAPNHHTPPSAARISGLRALVIGGRETIRTQNNRSVWKKSGFCGVMWRGKNNRWAAFIMPFGLRFDSFEICVGKWWARNFFRWRKNCPLSTLEDRAPMTVRSHPRSIVWAKTWRFNTLITLFFKITEEIRSCCRLSFCTQ